MANFSYICLHDTHIITDKYQQKPFWPRLKNAIYGHLSKLL